MVAMVVAVLGWLVMPRQMRVMVVVVVAMEAVLVVVDSGSVAALVVAVAALSRGQEARFHQVVRLCSRMRRHLSGTQKSGAKIAVILNSALV